MKHSTWKLSWEEAEEIRGKYNNSTLALLAKEYSVSKASIWNVVSMRTYKKKPLSESETKKFRLRMKREGRLKKQYGLRGEDVARMIESAGGKCEICKGPPDNRWGNLNIDHCHETGKVRGVICSRCNTTIGQAEDSPALLARMIEYLQLHGKKF